MAKLTQEQLDLIPVYRDIGIKIGLACGPSDREKVFSAFKSFYEKILNKPFPNRVIFVRSPMEAQAVIQKLENDKSNSHEKWTLETNDEFVQNLVKDFVVTKFTPTHDCGFGSAEIYWIQYARYFQNVLGMDFKELTEGINIYETLAKNSGIHWIFEEAVIVSDRPLSIMMENNQLHNDEGPAVAYGDGYKQWYINGHEVNEKIVMNPKSFTAKELSAIENSETKRIAIERFGPSEYMFELGGKLIDMDCLNHEGSSPRSLMEDSDGNRWLIGTDGSTGRVYFMPVLANVNTCREAHESISGLPENLMVAEC